LPTTYKYIYFIGNIIKYFTNEIPSPKALYALCLCSIWRHLEHSYYRIMFVMGGLDVAVMLVFCISACWSIAGAMYCSCPTFIYLTGALYHGINFIIFELLLTSIKGAFVAELNVEVLLAVNRCLHFVDPGWTLHLFGYRETCWRTWLWISLLISSGLYSFIFEIPWFWNSFENYFVFNPHQSYANEMFPEVIVSRNKLITKTKYSQTLYMANIYFVFVSLPVIYLLMAVALTKPRVFGGQSTGNDTSLRVRTDTQIQAITIKISFNF
jgi:hypothetical protein